MFQKCSRKEKRILMAVELNWSLIIASTISSVINAVAIFLATRWVGRAVDKIEKNNKK
jgi:hypothetical protein